MYNTYTVRKDEAKEKDPRKSFALGLKVQVF